MKFVLLAALGAFLNFMAPAAISADSTTPLLNAVEAGDKVAVQKLLTDGAAASEANRYGVTPLAQASQNGNAEIVKLLLQAGADVKAVQPGGETALLLAARTGQVACVEALLEKGAEINATERHGQTALMWAASQGNAEVVELLLAKGADFRVGLKSGFNALLFAVREGRSAVVKLILQAGADVNEVAPVTKPKGTSMRDGTSALMLAVENAHYALALELVAAGANPNDERSGFTPLHAVTWARRTARGDGDDGNPPPAGSGNVGSLEFVREMVKLGAKVNTKLETGSGGGGKLNLKGATPFLMAAQNVDLALLKVLAELGADPKLTNADHCTPLLAAAGVGVTAPGEEPGTETEALATLAWLLDHGADVNAVDDHGETVMHAAAYKIMPSLVTLLDARGADIAIWHRKNRSGWTPLMIAQGYRQGNFRPIAEMEAIISRMMRAHGIEPPPAPQRKEDAWKATFAEPITRGIEFAKVGETSLRFDLYRPMESAGKHPLIIWIHGGAWRAGDRKDMPLTALTRKGYCIASIDYRLTPTAPFPANIHDIKAAIRFLRAHAEEYAIDPNQIVLTGASAGGHLALLAALTTGNEALEGTVGTNGTISSQVQAVVSFYGASDLTTILAQSTPHGLSVRVPALELLYGGSAETKPELARLASPVFHLDPKDPPILLYHGDQDNQMPHAQSVGLHAACQAAGIPCEFHSVPGGEHGGKDFFGAEMLDEVHRFLQSKLVVTTEPSR